MEIEVMVSSPPHFNFDSATTFPYITAPSSPKGFANWFYITPASPTRGGAASFIAIPSNWEYKLGIPKSQTSTVAPTGDSIKEEIIPTTTTPAATEI